MVRFSIDDKVVVDGYLSPFTFHYGQIFNGDAGAIVKAAGSNLHSTMVRFSIDYFTTSLPNPTLFTFHYGQIFNPFITWSRGLGKDIYIPLWLDFQLEQLRIEPLSDWNLHSTMVRFSMEKKQKQACLI